jgi:hypothetical protein
VVGVRIQQVATRNAALTRIKNLRASLIGTTVESVLLQGANFLSLVFVAVRKLQTRRV